MYKMASILKVLMIVALGATFVMLVMGVVNLFRTSSTPEKSNQMMRWRVLLQALTLALFAVLLLVGKN